jgi:ADP-heptose:LPS heptosyltransferase
VIVPGDRPRLLVVSLDNLGDCVFSSGLIAALRETFPKAHIAFWCKEYAAPLTSLMAGLDASYACDPFWHASPVSGPGGFRNFISVAGRIRRARFDGVVISSLSWKAAAFSFLCGIPVRIGYAGAKRNLWLTHRVAAPRLDAPVLIELSRLLGPLGIVKNIVCRLETGPLEELRRTLRPVLGEKAVALHPFAGDLKRCVPLSVWAEAARRLKQEGWRPFWIGSPAETKRLKDEIGASSGTFSSDWGDAGLLSMAAAICLCRAFIGHDSGPLHVASALGVPCLGLFTPGEPRRTFPQGPAPFRLILKTDPAAVSPEEIVQGLRDLL